MLDNEVVQRQIKAIAERELGIARNRARLNVPELLAEEGLDADRARIGQVEQVVHLGAEGRVQRLAAGQAAVGEDKAERTAEHKEVRHLEVEALVAILARGR